MPAFVNKEALFTTKRWYYKLAFVGLGKNPAARIFSQNAIAFGMVIM